MRFLYNKLLGREIDIHTTLQNKLAKQEIKSTIANKLFSLKLKTNE